MFLKPVIKGEVADDETTLRTYSRDASIFDVKPQAVLFPKDVDDIKKIVNFAANNKISVTARSAGTDMTGGPLNEEIILDFTRYFKNIFEISGPSTGEADGYAFVQPGVYYRDFEKAVAANGWLLPSYPASKSICAVGGMVANNAGGEKSLIYGKTENYVEQLKAVLADGNEYILKPLSAEELAHKMRQQDFEGEVYRKTQALLEENYDLAKKAKPDVSKNSSGYNIWDIWDRQSFDLTKLFTGAQGTLGFITEIKFRLVKIKPHSGMLVVFLKDLKKVAEIVKAVLPFEPSSFESFDDHTLKLSLKFFPGFLKMLGARNLAALAWRFLPDFWTVLTFGMPKLVLLIEFEEESQSEITGKIEALAERLKPFGVKIKKAYSKKEAEKYWAIRRESFNLLRHKIKDKQTAPFIDDFIVKPDFLPEFLPKIYQLLDEYDFLYTIAGHVGDGNFHIIPLMNLAQEEERRKIPEASREVYKLVLEHKGSISAEHNDGLVRSPYLKDMFGAEVYGIFEEIKKIFDPQNIFNPRKKVGATVEYAMKHIKHG